MKNEEKCSATRQHQKRWVVLVSSKRKALLNPYMTWINHTIVKEPMVNGVHQSM